MPMFRPTAPATIVAAISAAFTLGSTQAITIKDMTLLPGDKPESAE